MLVPLSWLRDYVDLVLPLPELVERLTVAGLEVTGVRLIGLPKPAELKTRLIDPGPVWERDKVVTAEVLEVTKHPDADRLKLVTLNYGGAEPLTVVTGAGNISVGDRGLKVVLARAGAVLFDGHAEGKVLKELKPGKIRGILSAGMVCSEKELGIADDHEGIIILPPDTSPGVPLVDVLGDAVLEVDVLPNMARCLGIIGVAREVAALTGQELRLPARNLNAAGPPISGQVSVDIVEPRLCSRYAVGLITAVKLGPSPQWMQVRLRLAGMRPINNLVDITNYVMLEWGQPLHAFDFDVLRTRAGGKAPRISVRPAQAGEVLKTLDGQERRLTEQMLVIADAAGPIALAGVMGGAETEVTDQTASVLLESANFDLVVIRKTSRSLDLLSEASHRFSRGIHPELVRPALERALELMRLHAGGTVAQGVVDHYPLRPTPLTLQLFPREVTRVLGITISLSEMQRILRTLDFTVEVVGESLRVTAPPHRLDLQGGTADLIEEIARIYGYDKLPATLLAERLPRQVNQPDRDLEERIRDLLADLGLTETIHYSLTTPAREAAFGQEGREYVRLANPISSERVVMRRSVLASVIETAGRNLRQRSEVRLFEIGTIYEPVPGEPLPRESKQIALVMAGPRYPEHWDAATTGPEVDFFDLKGVVEALCEGLHLPTPTFTPTEVCYLHPGQAAAAELNGQRLGILGRLHPRVQEELELGRRPLYIAELLLDSLLSVVPTSHRVRALSPFPPVRQDLAVVVDESVPASRVVAEIWAAGQELLREVRLFDLYRGDNLPPGKKSLAYALTYQADDRTLTDKEVAKAHARIVARLEKALGAVLRGAELAK
jgi:phenylalanyl-tRNA synthetase beta chain